MTPRGVLEMLVVGGGMVGALAAGSTAFAILAAIGYTLAAEDRLNRKRLNSSVQYLKRKRYVVLKKDSDGVRICVTRSGEAAAKKHRARRALMKDIKRPERWDGKWRLVLFDIASEERSKRNAFRGMIARLGAVMVQKSIWAHPFDCSEQITLLREAFELSEDELRLVVADSIGNDRILRKVFGI